MLKGIARLIIQRILKLNWIKRRVDAARAAQEEQCYHEHWAMLLSSGCKVRNHKPKRLPPYDTLRIEERDGSYVDYRHGKIVERGEARPVFLDSLNWGVMRSETW